MLFLLVACGVLILPATALARSHRIVPFKSVAGVPLKLTPAQVRHRLGRPSHTVRVGGKVAEYDYHRLDLTVEFDTNHHPDRSDFVGVAEGAFTRHIRYSTVHGVHIGSTRRAVRRAFGRRCHWNLGDCTIWRGHPGAIGSTSLNFTFFGSNVTEIDIQYVFNDL